MKSYKWMLFPIFFALMYILATIERPAPESNIQTRIERAVAAESKRLPIDFVELTYDSVAAGDKTFLYYYTFKNLESSDLTPSDSELYHALMYRFIREEACLIYNDGNLKDANLSYTFLTTDRHPFVIIDLSYDDC